jgi:hypothetical protein
VGSEAFLFRRKMAEMQRVWLAGKDRKCTWNNGKCGGDLFLERNWRGQVKAKCLLCSREFELTDSHLRDLKKEGVRI